MTRIPTPPQVPGIVGLFAARPDTAHPLQLLAETLLRGPFAEGSTLSRGDRELVATVVSTRNECTFCSMSHAAFAAAQLDGGKDVVEAARGTAAADTAEFTGGAAGIPAAGLPPLDGDGGGAGLVD